MAKVKLGEKIPDFTVASTGDSEFSLSENVGKNIVIYFYPKDNTPVVPRKVKTSGTSLKRSVPIMP